MKVQVRERDLVITESERLVAKSVNEYTVQFTLDTVWEGYATEAVFQTQAGIMKAKIITDISSGQWIGISLFLNRMGSSTFWISDLIPMPLPVQIIFRKRKKQS